MSFHVVPPRGLVEVLRKGVEVRSVAPLILLELLFYAAPTPSHTCLTLPCG